VVAVAILLCLDKNAVFTVENAYAILDFIQVKPPGNIDPSQVTIDGEEVDSVTFLNGRYLINADSILSKVQNELCEDLGLPSKRFLLIRNVCPWKIRATYVIEGTVTTGGRACCFKLEISNADDEPATVIPNGCCSNFAIPDLAIPCVTNGFDPEISFHFTGKIKLVNPEIKVDCGRRPPMAFSAEGPGICAEFFGPPELGCTVILKSKVVVEPCVNVEVVRRTLFIVNAREGVTPCVHQLAGVQTEDEKRNDPCNNLAGMGFKPSHGKGRHDDCDGQDSDDVLGIEDICEELRGVRDNNHCHNDDVLGTEDVCGCIDFEERGCDNRCGCDRGCGCGCDDVRGVNTRRKHQARTAFQFNGRNGCSW
jgi:hypothetical protein